MQRASVNDRGRRKATGDKWETDVPDNKQVEAGRRFWSGSPVARKIVKQGLSAWSERKRIITVLEEIKGFWARVVCGKTWGMWKHKDKSWDASQVDATKWHYYKRTSETSAQKTAGKAFGIRGNDTAWRQSSWLVWRKSTCVLSVEHSRWCYRTRAFDVQSEGRHRIGNESALGILPVIWYAK